MEKYNVVIFFTDQQRWDTLGVHKNPMELTPNLDLAALEGTHCYHAFTPQPVCLPARACLQSGLYPARHGCDTNQDSLDFEQFPGLAHYFNRAGYQTAYIGKWHLKNICGKAFSEPQGAYQYWLAENTPELTSDEYRAVLHDGKGRKHSLPGYRVDAYTDAAVRYIDRHKGQPFFLMLSFLEPHFQNTRDDYPAPYGYSDRYLNCWLPPDLQSLGGTSAQHLPGYYGMVKRLDEAYGRMLDCLRSLDLLENTIVLFTSDHGCHFKTRNAEYKRSCHDSSLRVPMVWHGGPFQGGGRVQEFVSLVDVLPTLIDICDLENPQSCDGASIVPLVYRQPERPGKPSKIEPNRCVYAEISEDHDGYVIRTQRWKYSVDWLPEAQMWQESYLYDLKADPYELVNLIGCDSHCKAREVLRAKLQAEMQKFGRDKILIVAPAETSKGLPVPIDQDAVYL